MSGLTIEAVSNSFMDRLSINRAKAMRYGIWGGAGGAVGAVIAEALQTSPEETGIFVALILYTAVWFGMCGTFISMALIACSMPRILFTRASLAAIGSGAGYGFGAGAIGGGAAQFLYSVIGPTEILRIICWGIGGTLLGIGLSRRIPNLLASRGGIGGGIGGLVGGFVFVIVSLILFQVIGRIVGIGAIGFFIGLMIVFADSMLREAWLEIRFGTGEKDTFTIGAQPIVIGSDDRTCQVFASGAPAVALTYRLVGDSVECNDAITHTNGPVHDGDTRTAGKLTATVRLSRAGSRAKAPRSSTPAASVAPDEVRLPVSRIPARQTLEQPTFPLLADFSRVGTASDCHVCIQRPGVAPYHAEIRRENGRLLVSAIGTATVQVSFKGASGEFHPVTGRNAIKQGSFLRVGTATLVLHTSPDRLEFA